LSKTYFDTLPTLTWLDVPVLAEIRANTVSHWFLCCVSKRRPALVIADLDGEDMILCQITSVARNDDYAVSIDSTDFESGTLPVKSFVRPNKIFTASRQLALYSPCRLKAEKMTAITVAIIGILEG
jgi:mRNA interferase MazF